MTQLGAMHAQSFGTDPKHLGFVLARYHFVARMLAGASSVLEVGFGDCTGARIVKPAVGFWRGLDINPAMNRQNEVWTINALDGPVPKCAGNPWRSVYSLDVLEHILPEQEDRFFENINASLDSIGTVIVGMPSLESQPFASMLSRQHHVNCKTEDGLRKTLKRHYENVFLFGMNDCTLHTGFGPLCHYRLAICTHAIQN